MPDSIRKSFFQRAFGDVHTLPVKLAHRLYDKRGVGQLMPAEKPYAVLSAAVRETLPVKSSREIPRLSAHAAERIKHLRRSLLLRTRHRRAFDYRRLFRSDLSERTSEQRTVVQPYFGNDGECLGFDSVGRVPSAAESRFQHAHVAAFLSERVQRERGLLLECGGTELLHRAAHAVRLVRAFPARPSFAFDCVAHYGHIARDFPVRKRYAVYAEPLVVAEHGRRIVGARPVPCRPQHGSEHGAHRSFAVGAGDMHYPHAAVGRAEGVEQLPLALQPVIRAVGLYPADIVYRFVVKQKAPPQKHFFSQVKREWIMHRKPSGFSSASTPRLNGT